MRQHPLLSYVILTFGVTGGPRGIGSQRPSREATGAAQPWLPLPRRELERILALLPPNHRRVLQLRFQEGCTIKETARAMQVSEANAKVLQYQAVQGAAALVRLNSPVAPTARP